MPDPLLLALAPLGLPVYRSERYNGGGLGIPLDRLAPGDRELVRRVYDAAMAVSAARPGPEGDDRPTPEFVARVRDVADDAFVRAAQRLGDATVRAGADPLVHKALHDIRGGALTALIGTAAVLDLLPPDPGLYLTCGRLARDHCKIVRSSFPDLDPPRRAHDERYNYHGVEKFLATWDGVTVHEYGRPVAVAVACEYAGGVTASCLENAAVDRVLYNHINNAARHAADARVRLDIFPAGDGLIRWVVSNAVTTAQKAWLEGAASPGLARVYDPEFTSTGSGIGLASCVDLVAAAFGVSGERALADGYLGARLTDGTYRAWFHWPAFAGTPPAPGHTAPPIPG